MDKIIYKSDSKNKIRYLKVWNELGTLFQESGVLDTLNPIVHKKLCVPKNVGKSNETTPEQQAISEAEAIIKDKMTEGYFNTIEEASNEDVTLPMLAKDYKKEERKIKWDSVFVQPKLDGMRCLAIVKNGTVLLKSRDGKVISNMEHIESSLSSMKEGIYDGELYAHGLSFQENMKLIKKYRIGETEKIKYHIYDVILPNKYEERNNFINKFAVNFPHINIVLTEKIKSFEELTAFHSAAIGKGYEGSIVRHGSKGYEVNKRSDSLLKYKDFLDAACKIIDIIPAEQRPEWGIPVLEMNNKTFKAGTKMSHDERKKLLKNKEDYIGKTAELRFFEYTDDGIPRFPVMCGIRLDK